MTYLTPAVSPIVVVNKGKKIRICMDPTDLNKNIKHRHYPLTVEEIASRVKDAKSHKNGLSKRILANTRNEGHIGLSHIFDTVGHQYLRLPFGISSAPEIFSEIMYATLNGIENCEIAMDDIFLYAVTLEKLRAITKKVADRLKTAGFTLNKEKCEYEKQKVKFLGHIFTEKGIETDNSKIEAIQELREPSNMKELQLLLGMVTYLGKFIPNLSDITKPLRKLLHKENAWVWDHEQQKAFKNVKKVLSTTPVLRYYDMNKPVKLSVDASSMAIDACLMQDDRGLRNANADVSTTKLSANRERGYGNQICVQKIPRVCVW